MEISKDNINALDLINEGKKAQIFTPIGNVPAFVVPKDMHIVDLESLYKRTLKAPERIETDAKLSDLESFYAYVKRYETEATTVFIDTKTGKLSAALEYHDRDQPSWNMHHAEYLPVTSDEWNAWNDHDGERFSQEEFAEFIELRALEIRDPDASDMFKIATTLRATSEFKFERAIQTSNGSIQSNYREVIDGEAGENGQLEIPHKIKICVPVFERDTHYEIDAFFRYRIRDGKLSLFYQLIRPEVCRKNAIDKIIEKTKAEFETAKVYAGVNKKNQ